MSIERTLYSTEEMLGTFYDLEPSQEFWLGFFPGMHQSETTNIEWSKVTDFRHLAPLVLPTAQGKPTYAAAEAVQSIRPAYLKPKDAVQAAHMLVRRAGLGELGNVAALSPQERHDATIVSIMEKHRRDVERRWEWMAAQAVQNGSITLVADDYPEATVDFKRDAGHTIVLGSGSRWGESGVSIVDNIDAWNDMMADADFGGPATNLIVGTTAWKAMKADAEILALLNKDIRQTSDTNFDFGVGDGSKLQRKGNLSANIAVWVYSDYYQAADGTVVPFMDPRDVVMVGDSVGGVKCFGAIMDADAGFQALPMFPKMWKNHDPSATMLMTQSAPIMLPVNPNNTLRARVVA